MEYEIVTVLVLIAFLLVLGMYCGPELFAPNPYNTYALQADSWRQGRLDLGRDYPYLELAVFEGRYYCSFPPFPSYVLFPLTFVFGSNTPDGVILLLVDIIAGVCLYRTAVAKGLLPVEACGSALFFTICTNMVFIMADPAVWFMAQTFCFALSAAALYAAVRGAGGWSLFFWSCSVGCRPMQALFLPVLLRMLFQGERKNNPVKPWYELIRQKLYWGIPPFVMACSYLCLNGLRFGSVWEFGHNYLPEFMYEHQQFSLEYVAGNFEKLMHLPEFDEQGHLVIDHFGNLNFLLVNIPIPVTMMCMLTAAIKREKEIIVTGVMVLLLSVCYLWITLQHATMGGWHFGNRYTNDLLPWCYYPYILFMVRFPRLNKYQLPFAVFGLLFNVVGTVIVTNGL